MKPKSVADKANPTVGYNFWKREVLYVVAVVGRYLKLNTHTVRRRVYKCTYNYVIASAGTCQRAIFSPHKQQSRQKRFAHGDNAVEYFFCGSCDLEDAKD
jgi:hypothetical protein